MGGGDVSLDRQIEGCSTFIRSGPHERADLAVAYGNRGLAYVGKQEYARAIEDYTRSIEIMPRANAYFGRGYAHQQMRQYDQAINDYDQALKFDRNHEGAKRNRETVGRLAKFFKKSSSLEIQRRGSEFYRDKKYEQAVREYGEAIKLDPNDGDSYAERGRAYQKMGEHDLAMADFDYALVIDSKNGLALSYRAEAWALRGDFLRAARDLEMSVAVEEQIDGLDYLTLSGYYVKLKQYDLALAAVRKAYEYEGDDGVSVRHVTGRILQYLGRHREAVHEFTATIARFPRFVELYYRRGVSYERLGDRKRARADFQQLKARTEPKEWDTFGDEPGEVRAKLVEYGLH
jgi:tetratricopeptide (TPR) repeat protein